MKQISTAVGLWYKMNTQADMVDGPGWWAGDGAQVVTIVQCDGPDINILAAIHQTTVGGGAGLPRPPPPPAALPLSAVPQPR